MVHKAETKTAQIKEREEGIIEREYKKTIEIAKNLLDISDDEIISIKTGLLYRES
ncbi:hypothetical protein [Tepidibacter thalassicus]|uniref:Uncharacterized protein n=1 Tax=Tepidibacter thalassicus DSM 15285 TaxID=1123350 RepID=A0A1M5TYH0_9FIRM|nr:hypothetical protein [Tepidibacter thalassicus]SHH55666.1 hypothetical protein SAMN02744040_02337 [Tepidibacter thalassicus DSM 15285]